LQGDRKQTKSNRADRKLGFAYLIHMVQKTFGYNFVECERVSIRFFSTVLCYDSFLG
jgi:hypothetical protein